MTRYLAGVLSVIAVGTLLIAYGLLAPQAQAAFAGDERQAPVVLAPEYASSPALRSNAMTFTQPGRPLAVEAVPVRSVVTQQAPRAMRTTTLKRGRDWKKTAMVIGGSSAAGAGVGAIFGGRKGALIGAAIGGGASTIYETRRQ
jgi:hypothetical protein